jgi:hypothetical protein
VLQSTPPTLVEAVTPRAALTSPDAILRLLQDELFASEAFRAWVSIVSDVLPLGYAVEARRFRPGLDYTLATSEEKEARLDLVLGLTPGLEDTKKKNQSNNRKGKEVVQDRGWHTGEWGGWECYMAPHDEEEDPAIYRSGSSRKAHPGAHAQADDPSHQVSNPPHDVDDSDADGEDDADDDSTLLTIQPGFNRLLMVLRDERVMHFVKYVSAAAPGSRWDVCAEFEIGMVLNDEDD